MKSFFNDYKYIFIAQLYWPIWAILHGLGHPVIGIAVGSIVVCGGWAIAWYGFDSKEYKWMILNLVNGMMVANRQKIPDGI